MEKTYSIRDLELLSGIKAHTLRMWEQRYDLLHPSRTDTNIRQYSEDDLKRLLNVAILNKRGFRISRIADFSRDQLVREAYRILATDRSVEVQLDGLRHAMITLDEEGFHKVFANLTMRYGFEEAMIRVVYPFLELIGTLWQTHTITPLHEHFASQIIRQKLIVAIDMLPVPQRDVQKGVVLACPQDEYHELGLLFANYLFRSRGFHTIYIGANVPQNDIVRVVDESGIRQVFLSVIVQPGTEELPDYLKILSERLPDGTVILISGRKVADLPESGLPASVYTFSRIDELPVYLES